MTKIIEDTIEQIALNSFPANYGFWMRRGSLKRPAYEI